MSAVAQVKKRMAEMRDGIDDAEERAKDLELQKREAEARCLTAEGEVSSLKNRVFQLQTEIERIEQLKSDVSAKLDSANERILENDNVRKDLEGRETDNDQDLVMFEQSTKDTKVQSLSYLTDKLKVKDLYN